MDPLELHEDKVKKAIERDLTKLKTPKEKVQYLHLMIAFQRRQLMLTATYLADLLKEHATDLSLSEIEDSLEELRKIVA